MKRFGIKTINLLLCLLTVIAAACKDEEKETFTVNEEKTEGRPLSPSLPDITGTCTESRTGVR